LQPLHGGKKGAEDVAHGIDQEKALCLFGRHSAGLVRSVQSERRVYQSRVYLLMRRGNADSGADEQ
jgi:hypothetical protein